MSFNYEMIKHVVEQEKTHRTGMDMLWKAHTKRLQVWEMLPDGASGDNVIIIKPVLRDDWSDSRPKKPQSLAELHPEGKEGLIRAIANLVTLRQPSLWKQKFYTYVYNRDKANATKYHDKLFKHSNEKLEELNEAMERGEEIKIALNHAVNEGGTSIDTAEGGYLRIANEFKKAHEQRKGLLKRM